MQLTMLKCKLHRATVTEANLNYEGSITIGKNLCDAAGLIANEKVDIYNCDNGNRLATYVIPGDDGVICLNGAAARLVSEGDKVIICSYGLVDEQKAKAHQPTVIFVNENNEVRDIKKQEKAKTVSI